MNILNEIAEKTRERIERDKKEMPREDDTESVDSV